VRRLKKQLLMNPVILWTLTRLVAGYIRLIRLTNRWTIEGKGIPEQLWRSGQPFICCFWHNRLMLGAYTWPVNVPVRMLISGHPDGHLIAKTMHCLGINTLEGRKGVGGASVIRSMVRTLKEGMSVGITPDGPKGPKYRTKAGVAAVAKLSGCPVIPVACSLSRRKLARSWDRLIMPLPFGRGTIVWGRAIDPQEYLGQDGELREVIESELVACTSRADFLCSVEVP
jgi:lysophospholipid acyltransferase (LPLAT)-like uncharacterized protein